MKTKQITNSQVRKAMAKRGRNALSDLESYVHEPVNDAQIVKPSTTVWTNHGEPQALDDKHFGVEKTGKPILDALLNASESLSDVALQTEVETDTTRHAKHSPLPWRITYVGTKAKAFGGSIESAKEEQIALVTVTPNGSDDERKANADYIVKACNEYQKLLRERVNDAVDYHNVVTQRDELLTALKAVNSKLGEYEGKGDRRQGEIIILAWETTRDAIANASK